MFIQYNANPIAARVGDCTVRAISKALNQTWEKTYLDICIFGLMYSDMPSANNVWGNYLKFKGFTRNICPDCTVEQFCKDHPSGTYVLALDGHVVASINGDYYDTWQSGQEIPLFYWESNDV